MKFEPAGEGSSASFFIRMPKAWNDNTVTTKVFWTESRDGCVGFVWRKIKRVKASARPK